MPDSQNTSGCLFGVGQPKCLQGKASLLAALLAALLALWATLVETWARQSRHLALDQLRPGELAESRRWPQTTPALTAIQAFTTGC